MSRCSRQYSRGNILWGWHEAPYTVLLLSNTWIVSGSTLTASDDTLAVSGGTLIVDGGTLTAGDGTLAIGGSTLTICGGTLMSDDPHRVGSGIASMTW
jgi:hypothetical protein